MLSYFQVLFLKQKETLKVLILLMYQYTNSYFYMIDFEMYHHIIKQFFMISKCWHLISSM